MIDEVVEVLADALLAAVKIPRKPQIDIFEVARRAAVDKIVFEDILSDGRIENTPGFTRIILKKNSARNRQRFTLAHELGHVLLDDPSVALEVRRIAPGLFDTERLCEAFAAELLMPRSWIRTEFAAMPQDFDTLGSLAQRAGVSMSAALIQLAHHARWPTTLLFFSQSRHWEPSVMAAAPRDLRGQIQIDHATRCMVADVYRRRARRERTTLHFQFRGSQVEVECELRAGPSGVLALAPLRDTFAVRGIVATASRSRSR